MTYFVPSPVQWLVWNATHTERVVLVVLKAVGINWVLVTGLKDLTSLKPQQIKTCWSPWVHHMSWCHRNLLNHFISVNLLPCKVHLPYKPFQNIRDICKRFSKRDICMEVWQACLHYIQTFVEFKRHLYGGSASLFTLHTNLCKVHFNWRL